MIASKEQQRLETSARLKGAIEKAVGKYRHSDLTDGQIAAQIFQVVADVYVRHGQITLPTPDDVYEAITDDLREGL